MPRRVTSQLPLNRPSMIVSKECSAVGVTAGLILWRQAVLPFQGAASFWVLALIC